MEKQYLPNIIYHYTDQSGLLGILKTRELWASKIHYMNDASELLEPFRLAKIIIQDMEKQYITNSINSKQMIRDIASKMFFEIQRSELTNICVASFCAKGDVLSQWRGYGVPRLSFSIGFDVDKLVESIYPQPFVLQPCQYFNVSEYYKKIEAFIKGVYEGAVNKRSERIDFIALFIDMVATMKFDYFKEEEEWRLISQPISFVNSGFNFRQGKSMIIPYFSIVIDPLSIVEIIVRPCQNQDLVIYSVIGMVAKFGRSKMIIKNGIVNAKKIKKSQIPYRIR